MRRGAVGVALWLGLCGFGWGDVQETGTKAVKVSGTVLVWLDKGLHWSWDVLHNKVVHPAVNVLTLGIVNLDEPA